MQQCYFNVFETSACVFSCKFAAYLQKTFQQNTCGGLFFKLQKQMQGKQPTFNIFFDFSHIFRQIVIHIKVD